MDGLKEDRVAGTTVYRLPKLEGLEKNHGEFTRGRRFWPFVFLLGLTLLVIFVIMAVRLPGLSLQPVLSDSMSPYFGKNDLLLVREISPEEVRRGDVIVYEGPGGRIAHRVVNFTEGGFITKGDHNDFIDAVVSAGQLYGRVELAAPFVGLIARFAERHLLLAISLGILLYLSLTALSFAPFRSRRKPASVFHACTERSPAGFSSCLEGESTLCGREEKKRDAKFLDGGA